MMETVARRLTVVALLVVFASIATGIARSALIPSAGASMHCHDSPPLAPGHAPCGKPCHSLSPLACCNQPYSVTTAEVLTAPPAVFALVLSAPYPSAVHRRSLFFPLESARVDLSPRMSTVLRL
jgi:hypothetical protein